MLGAVRYQITLPQSAETVWDHMGDPGEQAKWVPDFAETVVEGSTRTITTVSGLTFNEELLVVDPVLRRIQYRVDLPVLTFHRGTLDVIALDDSSCVAVYATDTDPRIMALVIGAVTFRALVELGRQMEEMN